MGIFGDFASLAIAVANLRHVGQSCTSQRTVKS